MEQPNNITFDFDLIEPPNKDMHRFLWLGVHKEGVQTWDNSLVGTDFKDALIRDIVKNPYGFIIYYDFREMFNQEYEPDFNIYESITVTLEQVTHIVDKIIECIKHSRVEGYSGEQIIIFDITNTVDNIEMIYPGGRNI